MSGYQYIAYFPLQLFYLFSWRDSKVNKTINFYQKSRKPRECVCFKFRSIAVKYSKISLDHCHLMFKSLFKGLGLTSKRSVLKSTIKLNFNCIYSNI